MFKGRVYLGGSYGANFNLLRFEAGLKKKRYVDDVGDGWEEKASKVTVSYRSLR